MKMLINCKILIAKSAGFCFGVDRAVKIVYNKLNDYDNLVTLGPIIHNNNVVSDLKAKGVIAVDGISQIEDGQPVVIRSHGVGLETYESLKAKNVEIIDATCPFVERIHKLAYDYSTKGYKVLIAGDPDHPEVIGIKGHCVSDVYVFSDEFDLEEILKKFEESHNVVIVSQTTFNVSVWESCIEKIKTLLPSAEIFNTICNATAERQREAAELAQKVDIMIIVGGRHSSNTLKLKNVCDQYCKCYLIEGAEELKNIDFSDSHFIGISAGASTPAYIIKEVQQTMSEFLTTEEEFNFEEALEQSFKKIYTGAKVTGYITTVNNSEVTVDIGTKHTGIIPASELTDDPNLKPEDIVKPGDEIEVIVLKINDQEGLVTLSKKKVDAMKGFEKILTANEEGTILTGTVTNVVKGGILVSSNGVKVFIPASHATSRRDDKLEELLKKSIDFKIIDVNEARQRAVGSIRAVLKEAREAAQAKFFETAEVGAEIEGTVKSILDYGVFVDLGGVDGLIRKPDLSWTRIKHPSDVVSVGEKIVVTIKDIDKENNKISLSYKKASENPWKIFTTNYHKDDVVSAKIVSITSFGAFAQIIDGIDGLIHISQIANQRVNNVADILTVGDVVDVKIIEIDADQKRISLSMRALINETNEDIEETEEVEEVSTEE